MITRMIRLVTESRSRCEALDVDRARESRIMAIIGVGIVYRRITKEVPTARLESVSRHVGCQASVRYACEVHA